MANEERQPRGDFEEFDKNNKSSEFYINTVMRHLENLSADTEFPPGSLEKMDEIADVTIAAIDLISVDVLYRFTIFINEGVIDPDSDATVNTIETLNRRREKMKRDSFGGILSAHQLVVDNASRAMIGLLKGDPMDGWLLNYLQSDPEYAEHLGGIPDWLQPTE